MREIGRYTCTIEIRNQPNDQNYKNENVLIVTNIKNIKYK